MPVASAEILIGKAKFQPDVAVTVVEAVDMAIAAAELVTVPVLDARFATFKGELSARFAEVDARFTTLRSEIKAEMQELKAELVRWVFVVMLGNVALGAVATAIVNALRRSH